MTDAGVGLSGDVMRSQDVGEICVSQVTPGVVGREGRYQLLRISEREREISVVRLWQANTPRSTYTRHRDTGSQLGQSVSQSGRFRSGLSENYRTRLCC